MMKFIERYLDNHEPFYRWIVGVFIHLFYRVEHIGFDKLPEHGPALIIANHVAYMDGVVIQAGCKRPIRFLIDRYVYEWPIINYFMRHNKAIPILPVKEDVIRALDDISDALEDGHIVGIFPEGRLTYTGNLGRFKPGIEWIIERDPVPIYPVSIEGLWGSIFSRKYINNHFRWFPRSFRRKITLTCGDPIHPEHVKVDLLQQKILDLLDS